MAVAGQTLHSQSSAAACHHFKTQSLMQMRQVRVRAPSETAGGFANVSPLRSILNGTTSLQNETLSINMDRRLQASARSDEFPHRRQTTAGVAEDTGPWCIVLTHTLNSTADLPDYEKAGLHLWQSYVEYHNAVNKINYPTRPFAKVIFRNFPPESLEDRKRIHTPWWKFYQLPLSDGECAAITIADFDTYIQPNFVDRWLPKMWSDEFGYDLLNYNFLIVPEPKNAPHDYGPPGQPNAGLLNLNTGLFTFTVNAYTKSIIAEGWSYPQLHPEDSYLTFLLANWPHEQGVYSRLRWREVNLKSNGEKWNVASCDQYNGFEDDDLMVETLAPGERWERCHGVVVSHPWGQHNPYYAVASQRKLDGLLNELGKFVKDDLPAT